MLLVYCLVAIVVVIVILGAPFVAGGVIVYFWGLATRMMHGRMCPCYVQRRYAAFLRSLGASGAGVVNGVSVFRIDCFKRAVDLPDSA